MKIAAKRVFTIQNCAQVIGLLATLVVSYLAAMVLSLVPVRYRLGWQFPSSIELRHGTFLSGLVQSMACLMVMIHRYLEFFQWRVGTIGERAFDAYHEGLLIGKYVQFGIGTVTTVEYLFQPLTLLLAYFWLEGGVRLFAAAITGEIVATLPLYLAALAHDRIIQVRTERALGPRVRDEVEWESGEEYELHIASSRPKSNWNQLMTVAYADQMFEVVKQKEGSPPRRFVYLLRKRPAGKVIRGLHHYHPDEPLQEK